MHPPARAAWNRHRRPSRSPGFSPFLLVAVVAIVGVGTGAAYSGQGLFKPASDDAQAAQATPRFRVVLPPRAAHARSQPGEAQEPPVVVAGKTVRFRRLPDRNVLSTDSHVASAPGARISSSRYETTVYPGTYDWQGCRAGKGHVGGLVILDFGMPAYNGHTYGTILFGGRFASNREITSALETYAAAYVRCLPKGSGARIALARGTSNWGMGGLPSAFRAGRRWARETMALAVWLRAHGLDSRVRAAAANDAEPAWDPTFHRTRDFFAGFRSARPGYLLYNYGSLDGGVGSIWSLRQAFYVSGGMRDSRAVPQIYNAAMARQWADLASLAFDRYGRKVRFAGVMTQNANGCGRRCGYSPEEAHTVLMRELRRRPATKVLHLRSLTIIRNAFG